MKYAAITRTLGSGSWPLRNYAGQAAVWALALVSLVSVTALPLVSVNVSAASEQPGLISSSSQSLNRWSSNGPDGGSVLSLAIDRVNPATLYAGTPNGVFKSVNGGESWGSSLKGIYVRIVAIDPTTPTTVYAAGQRGIYKSTDGGTSWNPVNNGLENQYGPINVLALAIAPADSNVIYAAGTDIEDPSGNYKAIYKSTDGGGSWSITKHSIVPYAIHRTLAIDPINTNIIYAAGSVSNGTVWKSIDNGRFWSIVNVGVDSRSTVYAMAIDPTNTNVIYVGTETLGVYKSSDGGASWSVFNDGLPYYYVDDNGQRSFWRVNSIVIDPINPGNVYAGTAGGLFKGSSGGSWSALNTGLTNLGVNALAINPGNPGIAFAGTDGGVFKTTGGGVIWNTANNGLRAINAQALAINPGSANAIFTETENGVYKSTDHGGSWSPHDFYPLAFDPRNSNTIFARSASTGVIFKSTNNGATWTNAGLDYAAAVAIDPNNSDIIYAAADGLSRSTNGGGSWTAISDRVYPLSLVIDPDNSKTIYAISYDYDDSTTVFKSIDSGVTWNRSDTGAFLYGVSALVVDPFSTATIYVSAFTYNSTTSKIYKSTDRGESWSQIGTGLPDSGTSSLVVDPVHPNVIYTGTYGDGVFKSTDGGASWNPFNDGLTTLGINALAIDASGNFLHAGTQAGVFDHQIGAPGTPTPTPTPISIPTPTATPTPIANATPTPAATPNLVAPASWSVSGNLNIGRDSHTATRLQNGKVLVAGGNGSNGSLRSAELYDPATGTWTSTGNLNNDRAFHTATLLSNGKVLAAGGFSCAPPPQVCADVRSAELYDPGTGTWTSTGNLNTARSGQPATLLSNGKVLIAGGYLSGVFVDDTAELYDPATGLWSVTGNLNAARVDHTSTLLPGGKVLVTGGANSSGDLNSAEVYDPATGTWSITGNLNLARQVHTATLLPTGKVLVAAGFIDFNTGQVTNSAELYDPATGLWSITGNLNTGRTYHTMTLLAGGKVLVAGGFFFQTFPNITNSAELYDPATGTWSNTASLNNGRRFHAATLLLNGKVLASGGGPIGNSAELYDIGSEPVVLTADQVTLKSWTYQGRTYAYVKLTFPNSGYFVADWGLPTRSGNDFTVNALVERSTGTSVQAVTTTAQIYDLGPLPDGTYTFTFKNSGTVVKSQPFTVSSTAPLPNPIDNQREFVKQQYRDFLNREADQAGEDFWTDNITKCSDPARRPPGQTEAPCTLRQRETTSGAFFQSPEFQYTGYFVYRMYVGALGRQPKLSEFTPDAQFVGAGILVNSQLSGAKINQNKADFAAQFVNCTDAAKSRCAEFKAIYDGLSNQAYVDKLFQTTGVNASAADRAALVNELQSNPTTGRASVLQKVVDGINVISEGNQQFTTTYGQAFYNAEFNWAFVLLQYFGYMKRDPDDAGYAFWLGKLNQFNGNFVNAEMVLAFISSPEYRARFGQP